jgi:AhpD family alkylhydroperoxidase
VEPRMSLSGSAVMAKAIRHLGAASQAVFDGTSIPKSTQDMVLLRASQINGCGFCTDMHTKDLAHAGESAVRINLVAAWREATVFTDAERAALELTEEGTRIADAAGGVPDEVWERAGKHFEEEDLAALVCLISLINASNRLCVMTRQPGGAYQPAGSRE